MQSGESALILKIRETPIRVFWLHDAPRQMIRCETESAPAPNDIVDTLTRLAPDARPQMLRNLASRIANACRGACPSEIHLPYVSARDWGRRNEILRTVKFRLQGDRLLPIVYTRQPALLNHYQARLMAAGVFQPSLTASIQAVDGNATISIPAGFFSIWRTSPPEGDALYFRSHAPASIAVQSTLRRILPQHWLQSRAHYRNIARTCAMLAYSSSMPCYGRRPEFTFDFMTRRWFASAFHFARKPLIIHLASSVDLVRANGHVRIAAAYQKLDAKDLLDRFRRRRQPVKLFFAAEERIINQVLAMGAAMRIGADTREIATALLAGNDSLETRLRRFTQGRPFPSAVPLLMIEATRALADRVALLKSRGLLAA